MKNSLFQSYAIAVLLGFISIDAAVAAALETETTSYEDVRFGLGIGVGIVEFDTNIKVTDKSSGSSHFLDLEGNLGLQNRDNVNTIFGVFRFNPKHSLQFGHFGINRDSTLLDVSENFNDIITIDADITIEDNTRFYYLGYGYNFFRNEQSDISFVVGLNALDLRLQVEAQGEITVLGQTRSEYELAKADVLAPLPLFGFNFGVDFTPKWSLATKILVVGGSYKDVKAFANQVSIISKYRFSKHTGFLLGWNYFDTDVEVDDDDNFTEVSYGYNGLFLGLNLGF